ncbi:histidinol-phosphatase HisJ [Clostridium sp. SHJSY1]|uniref:histidinol-phosphatase HisJ n=1 Tax=Clostridium sp. SHJSY1 TaxID=2942483 RepID=UPI002876D50D|nr:histidinol-phosphatase HisJ [Clostridium sp. SHJSY1]MDS0526279.1 histidinol-phosphatase HisJ [Clostridium sp. SHJSY1]
MKKRRIVKDGHIHSPYCPHGTSDKLKEYVDKALEMRLEEISFTEHMPLPKGFVDEKIILESSPTEEEFEKYLIELEEIKRSYEGKIKINIGTEVDYIDGLEKKTRALLYKYGIDIEDSILSVHFIRIDEKYYCIDYSKETFKEIADILGGIEKLYDRYFETLLKSIKADIGIFKPRRIGHSTLVRRFNKEYPFEYKNEALLEEIVKEMKEKNYEIDHNTSGLRKEYCEEEYPSGILMELIKKYNIPEVYGSDAHTAKDVGASFNYKE